MEKSKDLDGPMVTTTKLFGELFQEGLERILEWLVRDDASSIGIYGMGGVGKTTLAKHIHENLLMETDFSVCWVTVSQEFSIKKLQNDIAKLVELDLSNEDDEEKRASMLSIALMKQSSVIIIDDVWEEFSLESVGIPIDSAKCRLILTTHSREACERMCCERVFEVKCLESDEAWHLFKNRFGPMNTVFRADVGERAESMAERCAGLPLGIVTMAGSMRGMSDIHEWRSALERLKDCSMGNSMDQNVLTVLEWSYNRLNEVEKNCFLYCCLYPEDHRVPSEELINLFVLAELIPRGETRESELGVARMILSKLIKVCLLEEVTDCHGHECVKMHDLIREMALRMTQIVPKFLVKRRVSGLSRMEEDKWTEDLNAVSFILSYENLEITQEMSPKCPNLTTMLFCNAKVETFPDPFFRCMDGLKVLNLQWCQNLKRLPDSISDLVNLTALFLRGCKSLKLIPPLGKLKHLRELNLSDSGIESVPEGLEDLLQLERLFLLSSRLKHKIIPEGTLSKLQNLQHLESSAYITDREFLKQLKVFKGHLTFPGMYTQFITSQCWPKHYVILVGGKPSGCLEDRLLHSRDQVNRLVFNRCEFEKELPSERNSKPKESEVVEEESMDLVLIPEDVGELTLSKCSGLSASFFKLLFRKSKNLSKLIIHHSEEVGSLSFPDDDHLRKLQVLMLKDLPNLVRLSSSEDPPGKFSYLSELYISRCSRLKKLFPPRLHQNLKNLEKLVVEDCDQLEEIASTTDNHDYKEVQLPKVQVLCLERLPRLRQLGFALSSESMVRIWIHNCPKFKKLPLLLPTDSATGEPSPPKSLKVIRGSKKWWKSLEWDNPTDKDALQPFFQGSLYSLFS